AQLDQSYQCLTDLRGRVRVVPLRLASSGESELPTIRAQGRRRSRTPSSCSATAASGPTSPDRLARQPDRQSNCRVPQQETRSPSPVPRICAARVSSSKTNQPETNTAHQTFETDTDDQPKRRHLHH